MGIAWYLIPLAVVISLVYSASRYELPDRILARAVRLFFQITLCMATVFVLLWTLTIWT